MYNFNPRVYHSGGETNLLLLHGFMGNGEDWTPVINFLPDSVHCLAIDLPGHADHKIDASDLPDILSTADALFALLQTYQQKKWLIAGYSLGGRIALHLALHYPQICAGLIIESANPGIAGESERAERLASDRSLANRIEVQFDEIFLRNWYKQPLFASMAKNDKFNDLCAQRLKNQPRQLKLAIESFSTGKQRDLTASLTGADFPVCLINGQADEKYHKINRELYSRLKTAKWFTVAGAGHNAHFEYPEIFAELIQIFMSSIHGG